MHFIGRWLQVVGVNSFCNLDCSTTLFRSFSGKHATWHLLHFILTILHFLLDFKQVRPSQDVQDKFEACCLGHAFSLTALFAFYKWAQLDVVSGKRFEHAFSWTAFWPFSCTFLQYNNNNQTSLIKEYIVECVSQFPSSTDLWIVQQICYIESNEDSCYFLWIHTNKLTIIVTSNG